MKSLRVTLSAAFLLFVGTISSASAAEYVVTIKADGKSLGESTMKLQVDKATITTGGDVEEFDLKEMRWKDDKGSWVTLADGKLFAEKSKEQSAASAATAPENLRPFVTWLFDPKFTKEVTGDDVRLTSGQVDYALEGKIETSPAELDSFIRYMTLNAYRKAMTEKKFPPFPELRSIEAMKESGHIPSKTTIKIVAIPGAPSFEIGLTLKK